MLANGCESSVCLHGASPGATDRAAVERLVTCSLQIHIDATLQLSLRPVAGSIFSVSVVNEWLSINNNGSCWIALSSQLLALALTEKRAVFLVDRAQTNTHRNIGKPAFKLLKLVYLSDCNPFEMNQRDK